uniref:Peptidase M13 C-terminal domain-containing protein n=1 Tax=viral metagenome TaxID=1070528 RepID=A0A6C0ET08_9ZZZZ
MGIYTLKKIIKIKKLKNKSIKNREKKFDILSDKQKELVCKNYSNTYNTFEDKIEKTLKENNIDTSSKNFNLDKEILSDLKKAVSPSNILPENDFYSYINDRWLQKFQLEKSQKYIVQVDDFRLVQDKVYNELLDIVKHYISDPKTKHTKKAKCIKNFYESHLITSTQEQSKIYSNTILNKIDELRKDNANLWKMLGFTNLNEIVSWGSPFVWSLNPDDKNPKIYRCYIEPNQVSLIDINIYFDDGSDLQYKKMYKTRYLKYLKELFNNVFGENNDFNVEDIFNCEVKLVNSYSCNKKVKESENGYNLVTTTEAKEIYNFDWSSFSQALGFDYTPNFFITSNLNYLYCCTKLLLNEWNNPEWRAYWIYIFIRQEQRYNVKGKDIFYDFQGKFVRGQEAKVIIQKTPIYGLGFAFNTFLTNEYINKYENPQLINYVKTMAEDLKTVYIRIIKRNKWMQSKTKEMALKKLHNFKLTVGSPKILREDPLLDYTNDDPWGNLCKIAEWRHNRAIKLEGEPIIDIPVIDWTTIPPKFVGTQAYLVNAAYTPSENGIYIPLGYIQKPFVDLDERGIEYNLAHIGFTIAHEMSHALDDWGSQYDMTGKLNDWWSEKDKKLYKKIQNDVIKQYEVFASYDGIYFDAEPSIGEDLADISGLSTCTEYLRDFQLKNDDILPIQTLSFEVFFVYFAFQQRQKLSKKALEAQLKINPHPPDKYRTNVPLSRLPVFRTLFNVKKGDKMWWHSTSRVW